MEGAPAGEHTRSGRRQDASDDRRRQVQAQAPAAPPYNQGVVRPTVNKSSQPAVQKDEKRYSSTRLGTREVQPLGDTKRALHQD